MSKAAQSIEHLASSIYRENQGDRESALIPLIQAVLNDPELTCQAVTVWSVSKLYKLAKALKVCRCGDTFEADGKRVYCSATCSKRYKKQAYRARRKEASK